MQDKNGVTYINASSGKYIDFRIDNYWPGPMALVGDQVHVKHIRARTDQNLTYDIGTSSAQFRVGYAYSWTSSSDDRLKDNETDISGALETIMKLKPQTYDFKNSEEADAKHLGLRSGFIAQDVLEIPELAHAVNVPENETEKVGKELDESGNIVDSDKEIKCYLSLDYNTIFTHGIAAIKELDNLVVNKQTTINELNNKVTTLENENTNFKNELNVLKNTLNQLLTVNNMSNI